MVPDVPMGRAERILTGRRFVGAPGRAAARFSSYAFLSGSHLRHFDVTSGKTTMLREEYFETSFSPATIMMLLTIFMICYANFGIG